MVIPKKPSARLQSGSIHVYARGNGRRVTFYDDEERYEFLRKCNRIAQQYDTQIEAFVLMDNHVHLQLQTNQLSKFMKVFLHGYSFWYNMRHGSSDKLFKTPFGSACKYSTEWQIRSILYILQNPVAAGICKQVSEYPWSSYNFYFQGETPLREIINIDTQKIESYYENKKTFDWALTRDVVFRKEIAEPKINEWKRISDAELSKHLLSMTKGENIYNLSEEKMKNLIIRLMKETDASLSQIALITHESYYYVKRIHRDLH